MSGTTPTYSFPSGLSLSYGSSEVITGTCSGTDSCQIKINGAQVAVTSGTGTVSYNFQSSLYGGGTFKIKFCDTTLGICTPDPYLTVDVPIYLENATSNPALTFGNTITSLPSCGTNFLGGVCTGDDLISGTVALTSPLIVLGNVTFSAAAMLTTYGIPILTTGTFNSMSGNLILGKIPLTSSLGEVNLPLSFGGSGGGTPSYQNGFSTRAAGGISSNGATPSIPPITSLNVSAWFKAFNYYLSGASGGGCNIADAGGLASYGQFIEANNLYLGVVRANGTMGSCGPSSGGGGGSLMFAYGTNYEAGTYNVSGGTGQSGGRNGGSGNIIVTHISNPITLPLILQYYPNLLYTQSPSSAITYTLYQTYNGITTTLQNGVLNISYIPPANQPPGIYSYNVVETQGSNTITVLANLSVNMTDITSTFGTNTLCSVVIQYFPNCASVPSFSVIPTKVHIQSDNPLNSYGNGNFVIGTNNIDVWSNANLTLIPKITLTYSFTSFTANCVNNPLGCTPISQTPLAFLAGRTTPLSPVTRDLFNITTYDQQFQTPLNAVTTASFQWTFNNYTGSNSVLLATNISSFGTGFASMNTVWIPNSLWTNPPILINNLSTLSTAGLHFPTINNFFSNDINHGTWPTYPIYLANNANGSLYTFYVYQCNGYAPTGAYMWSYEGSGAASTAVQKYKISAIPFSLPLQNGQQYSFQFWTAGQSLIFTQPASVNPLTITIYLPCAKTNVTNPAPVINATCLSNTISNTVTCRGIDTQNYVDLWSIHITYHPNIISTATLASNIIQGSSFVWTYELPNHSTVFYASINATVGRNIDPLFSVMTNFPLFTLGYSINPTQSYDAIFGILLFFIFIGVAYINEIAAIIGYPIIMILGSQLGIFQFAQQYIYGAIGLMIVVGILMMIFRD
jgi:hypothetical protein